MHTIKRLFYYIFLILSFLSRALKIRSLTMFLLMQAHKSQGVVFHGIPRYIHTNAYLDGLGGLHISSDVVISTNVIILTHDYSYNVGLKACNKAQNGDTALFDSVFIGNNTFIGAGSIILPGTKIGDYCVIGAGCVVKGNIEDYSVVIGNPCKIIKNTKEWTNLFLANQKVSKFHVDK